MTVKDGWKEQSLRDHKNGSNPGGETMGKGMKSNVRGTSGQPQPKVRVPSRRRTLTRGGMGGNEGDDGGRCRMEGKDGLRGIVGAGAIKVGNGRRDH